MSGTTSTDMRDVLVAAALTVLARDGAAGLTVRSITREARCSTTGVYTYFGGKHGLVEAIYLDGFESFDVAIADSLAAGDLIAAGHAYRHWALANPMHYLVMFGRAVPDFVPSATARARGLESFEALVDAVQLASDRTRPEAVSSAYHYYATVHGHVMLELSGMVPVDPATLDSIFTDGLSAVVGRVR